MVNTQIIANELNNKLNTIANALNLGHQFRLMAHIGKAKQGNDIDGILKPVNSNALSKGGTDTGTVNSQIVYVAEVIVPTAIDNKSVLDVENAITKLVHDYNGYSFVNGSDNIIWELSMGTPKDYAMRGGTGLSMPMAFTVKVSYSDVGLINGVKAWTLDGETIPYTGEGVILDKEGVTLSVLEAKTQQTIPTSQRKQYKFTIPYDKTNVVCTTLQNDILNGDFRKTYTLAYNDGVITYSAQVSLFKTGDIGSQKTGDATMLNVSFVDAGNYTYYDEQGAQINYQIGLINFPFDDQSENTLYFDSQATQQAYMEGKVFSESTTYLDMTAPNLNTTVLTNVVYDAGRITTGRYDLNRLSNLNYAIIKKTIVPPNTSTSQKEYYYYWVTQCTQGADGILLLDLKLDTIQTYMFNPNISIPDCLIERAHLNRWCELSNDNTQVRFDTYHNKALLVEEPQIGNCEKTCTVWDELRFKWTGDDAIDTWLNSNVAYWVYAFVPSQDVTDNGYVIDTYNSAAKIKRSDTTVSLRPKDGSIYNAPYGCFAYPVYTSDKKIKVKLISTGNADTFWELGQDDFKNLLERNNLTTEIISLKASMLPPLGGALKTAWEHTVNDVTEIKYYDIYVDSDGNLIIPLRAGVIGTKEYFSLYNTDNVECCRITSSSSMEKAIRLFTAPQQLSQEYKSYATPYIWMPKYSKATIKAANRQPNYNPKLLQIKFRECKIRDVAGFSYSYDNEAAIATYTDDGNTNFLYTESIQPEVTRYCCRIDGQPLSSPYTQYLSSIYSGLIGSIDTTLPLTTTNYAQFISNNRNYWLQTLLGFGQSAGTTALAAGMTAANPIAIGGSVIGSVTGLTDKLLYKDNLEKSPASIRNTSGSILSNLQINKLNIGIEIWEAFDTTKQMAEEYMYKNGFFYNVLDNVLNHIHTRKYFNYVKAQITDIQGIPLSNIIRNDIKQRFRNGLRFWNYTTYATYGVQYQKENYELWLDD